MFSQGSFAASMMPPTELAVDLRKFVCVFARGENYGSSRGKHWELPYKKERHEASLFYWWT